LWLVFSHLLFWIPAFAGMVGGGAGIQTPLTHQFNLDEVLSCADLSSACEHNKNSAKEKTG
jgi:hypothetical protein